MVTEVSKGRDTTVRCFRGLSTDSKPTDAGNGAEFREIDTGDIYYFNEAGSAWVKWTGGSGGGGGGGSSDFSTAQVTISGLDAEMLGCFIWDSSEEAYTYGTEYFDGTYTVVLYKGMASLEYTGEKPFVVTGSATVDLNAIAVTGDCTITIS